VQMRVGGHGAFVEKARGMPSMLGPLFHERTSLPCFDPGCLHETERRRRGKRRGRHTGCGALCVSMEMLQPDL
jgi:hypothetical protein